ncbi:hypothetical protein OLZ31_02595 [Enterobacter asburiae]|nr:hypothetical protein [Enterobacter asburiae]
MASYHVSVNVLKLNNNYSLFKINDIVSGLIFEERDKQAAVIMDGGYVLGKFHCFSCAIDELKNVVCNYIIARHNCGIEYSDYKRLHLN